MNIFMGVLLCISVLFGVVSADVLTENASANKQQNKVSQMQASDTDLLRGQIGLSSNQLQPELPKNQDAKTYGKPGLPSRVAETTTKTEQTTKFVLNAVGDYGQGVKERGQQQLGKVANKVSSLIEAVRSTEDPLEVLKPTKPSSPLAATNSSNNATAHAQPASLTAVLFGYGMTEVVSAAALLFLLLAGLVSAAGFYAVTRRASRQASSYAPADSATTPLVRTSRSIEAVRRSLAEEAGNHQNEAEHQNEAHAGTVDAGVVNEIEDVQPGPSGVDKRKHSQPRKSLIKSVRHKRIQ